MPNDPSSDARAETEPPTDFSDFAVVSTRTDRRDGTAAPADEARATGRGAKAAASASSVSAMSALEDRLKRGAERFQFGALIDGPSRPPRPAKQHVRAVPTPPAPTPEPATMPAPTPHEPLPTQPARPAAAQPSPAAPPAAAPAPRALRAGPTLAAGGVLVAGVAAVAAILLIPGRRPAPSPTSRGMAAQAGSAPQSEARSPGLPDPALTPGERSASAGEAPASAIPESLRRQVLKSYGVGPGDKRTVVCRLVPASLGGATTARNLFPVTPWFADLKARLDAKLTQDVKAGRTTAEQAAREETGDWVQAVHAHGIRNYGLMDAEQARQKEQQLRW